jgi:hypothetical protein
MHDEALGEGREVHPVIPEFSGFSENSGITVDQGQHP